MKRIRCPKCDEPILFDETQYEPGRSLVFECPECHKQFKLRIPEVKQQVEQDDTQENEEQQPLAIVTVVENAFHFKQELLIYEGDNVIGRHVKGSKINTPIKAVDPSVDTTHCVIKATVKRTGEKVYSVKDGPSNTGTFVGNKLLGLKEQVRIETGDVITIGATTMIFEELEGE
jgi:cytochrome c1